MGQKKTSLLWTIEGPLIVGKSYLFGTMHVKDRRAFGFKAQVEQAILQCDSFACEFNLEEAQHNLTADSLNLSNNLSLRDLIAPRAYQKAHKVVLKRTGLDLDFFAQSKPIYITNMLAELVLSKDEKDSLDTYLWNFAKENDRITLGIETLQEQIEIMQKIPLDFQVKALISTTRNFKKFRKQVLQLANYYEQGKLQKLYKATKKSIGGMRKILLYDRNKIMADRISQLLQEQSLFAAVGAAHLPGKKGVINHLKKEGYKLKPVILTA